MLTIITINFNNIDGLSKTLNSINKQISNFNYEHVIVDGASIDGSFDILKKYANNKKNVKWVSEPDTGIYNAMNKGIRMATNRYVAFLNSGDIFYNNDQINYIISILKINPAIDFLYGDLDIIDKNSKVDRVWISGSFSRIKLYLGWVPPHPMTTIRKSIIISNGCFDERFKISADYDLMLNILIRQDLNVHYINKKLVKMKSGGISNGSYFKIIIANLEVLKSWFNLKGFFIPYWVFITKPLSKLIQIYR